MLQTKYESGLRAQRDYKSTRTKPRSHSALSTSHRQWIPRTACGSMEANDALIRHSERLLYAQIPVDRCLRSYFVPQ
jgi:hypothetical protein